MDAATGATGHPGTRSGAPPDGVPSGDLLRDQPLSFDPRHRRYALRSVVTDVVTVANPHARSRPVPEHDPTLLLGGGD
jgi:CRISPR system Cascade subunit CasD